MVWDISVRYHWPLFFADETGNAVTLTSDWYVHVVNDFLLPDLRRRDIDLVTFWFQQDGATAHTARQSMNTLRTMFEYHIFSLYCDISWPVRSPNLSVCDFFLWGCLKSKVFQARPAELLNLREFLMKSMSSYWPSYFA
jgi:hypothetical protein